MPPESNTYVFPPDSEIWRVNRYRSGLIFGPQAVLLQVSRPEIAQAVAAHSDFRGDPLGRLKRTLSSVNQIAFGTREQAEKMRGHLVKVHDRVQGPGYSAFDPDLQLWVLSTLIDAAIRGHELVWEPLPAERRERFYRDMREFGGYFGLAPDYGHNDFRTFSRWFADALEDPRLGSAPLCSEVASAVVRPQRPLLARGLGIATDFIPIETVPSRIRDVLGFRSTAWTRMRMRMLRWTAPAMFRILPKRLTYYPEAYQAERRLGLA